MSAFDTVSVQVARLLNTMAADAVTYTPPTGAAVSLQAIVGPVRREEVETQAGRATERRREIKILFGTSGDTPAGVQGVALNGYFTIDSLDWAVVSQYAADDTCIHLELVQLAPRTDVGKRHYVNYRV